MRPETRFQTASFRWEGPNMGKPGRKINSSSFGVHTSHPLELLPEPLCNPRRTETFFMPEQNNI